MLQVKSLDDEAVDLYHAVLHGKTWQCWMQVVYVLPREANPQTQAGQTQSRVQGRAAAKIQSWRPMRSRNRPIDTCALKCC